MKRRRLLLIGFLGLLALFAVACGAGSSPDAPAEVVEIEVDAVVEVEVEVEEEMADEEPEMVEELEEEAMVEEEEEIIAQATEVFGFTDSEPVEATGSEGDEGSPAEPDTGQKTGGRVEIAMADVSEITSNEATVRVINDNLGELVIISAVEVAANGERLEMVITDEMIHLTNGTLADGDLISDTLEIPITAAQWTLLTNAADIEQVATLSETAVCEPCGTNDPVESVILILDEQIVMLEIPEDGTVPELENLLFLLRTLRNRAETALIAE